MKHIELLKQSRIKRSDYADGIRPFVETFNVFTLLGIQYKEVSTHSRFIGELLNPEGSHGMRNLFLYEFLKLFPAIEIHESDEWIVRLEETHTYGRYDITISNNRHIIIIENKINASEQPEQINRYYAGAKEWNYEPGNTHIIFLTLTGRAPISHTNSSTEAHLHQWSYIKQIQSWLQNCIAHTQQQPDLQVILTQYCNVINIISNQHHQDNYMQEVKELILTENAIKEAKDICDAFLHVQAHIQLSFWRELAAQIKERGLSFTTFDDAILVNGVNDYYFKSRNNRNYGLPILLHEYSSKEFVEFWVSIDHSIYYSLAVVKNGKCVNRDKYLKSSPYAAGIQQYITSTRWTPFEYNDYLAWKYPQVTLDFKYFNSDEVCNLVNPVILKKTAATFADEILALHKAFIKCIK